MLDKVKFLEMLGELKEFAFVSGNAVTQEEIRSFFDDTDLSEEHYKHIYAYLAQNQIHVNDYLLPIEKKEEDTLKEEDSIYLKMYLKDLKMLNKHTKEEEQKLLFDAKNQKAGAKEQVIAIWLSKVVRLSKKYKNRGVSLEDLIQEGNIGLLSAMEKITTTDENENLDQYLKSNIIQAIEQALNNYSGLDVLENTLVGKSNLIQEAASYLAQDLGRVATLKELADYTKISDEEIKDIRALSLEAIKLGDGE